MKTSAASPLVLIALCVALLVGMPVASVIAHVFDGGTSAVWAHLAATVLPEYLASTLWLCLGVAAGTLTIGVTTAWLVVMHEFPGRRFFEWALLLPLAAPAYVLAYVYTDFLQFAGPLQSALRESFGWSRADYWFPDVRSLGGAVAMFVFVLYPYVYLLSRTAFLEAASGMHEAARTLGCGPWRSFFRVALPLARPGVVAGVTLALMETLADYGTVSYFGVSTFTTGIYRAWFSLGDRVAAAQLAAALLGCVTLFLLAEQTARRRARFHNTTGRNRPALGRRLQGLRAIGATLACILPLLAGFVLPAGLLLRLTLDEGDAWLGGSFLPLARNSFILAGSTALLAVALALALAYGARLTRRERRGRWMAALNRLVSLGYAVPGSVVAVGILIPVTQLDHRLAVLWQVLTGHNPGLVLTGGIAALIYAYLVRFLAVALQSVGSGLARVTPGMDEAAQSLGAGQGASLRRVHLPILRGSLFSAALLVFVDVMKELPATLVMRPFDFDTLATCVHTLASDERLSEAAAPSLAIVLVGLLPIIVLSRQIAGRSTHVTHVKKPPA